MTSASASSSHPAPAPPPPIWWMMCHGREEMQRLHILQERINQQVMEFSREMLGTSAAYSGRRHIT